MSTTPNLVPEWVPFDESTGRVIAKLHEFELVVHPVHEKWGKRFSASVIDNVQDIAWETVESLVLYETQEDAQRAAEVVFQVLFGLRETGPYKVGDDVTDMTEPTSPTMNEFERAGRHMKAIELSRHLHETLERVLKLKEAENALAMARAIVEVLTPVERLLRAERDAAVARGDIPPPLPSRKSEPT